MLDIDACINNPCDANADCVDAAPPALDDPAGRTCSCNAGYSGDGENGNCAGTHQLYPTLRGHLNGVMFIIVYVLPLSFCHLVVLLSCVLLPLFWYESFVVLLT